MKTIKILVFAFFVLVMEAGTVHAVSLDDIYRDNFRALNSC